MHSFFIALQFLTRIRVVKQTSWTVEEFGRSTRFFPLVGLVLGVLLFLAAYLLSFLDKSIFTAAVLVLLSLFLTGGLHYDGLMDTCDGIFSGREKARKLEIMKDSRVGSFGVLAACTVILFDFACYAELPAVFLCGAAYAMPIIGRTAVVVIIYLFPYGREEGIGKAFSDLANQKTVAIALLTTAILIIPLGMAATLALGCGLFFSLMAASYICRSIDGLTGDTYGAVERLTESVVLLTYFIASFIPGFSQIFWGFI